ncbi:MAG: SagB/ThcOx family dehydrogenase [Candidatus Omnitrophota bacterium]
MTGRTFRILLLFAVTVFFISGIGFTQGRGEVVKLPDPKYESEMSVEQAIFERRSVRSFTDEPLSLEEVSQLLWAAGGKTVDGVTGPTRAYASAGAAYPLEIYLVAGNVTGLEPGVYRYNWRENSITLLKKGDVRRDLMRASYGQGMIDRAPATIVITALFERTTFRYGERGRIRYVPMDAGHLGQNVHLQAHALGLGTLMLGAFTDREVAKVIGSVRDVPVYIMPIGKPR